MNQSAFSNHATSVVHCYRTYFPDPQGGGQEAIRQIALATNKHGVQNKIFSLSPNPTPQTIVRPEGTVTRTRSWIAPASCDMGWIDSFVQFSQLANSSSVLHYHFPWPFSDVLHWWAKSGSPALLTYHSDIVRQRLLGSVYEPLMWRMLRSMNAIVATSPAYANTSPVLSHRSIRDKVHVIPLGIDESEYPKSGDPSVFTRIGIRNKEPYFLFIGVLRYYKGLSFLVRAATHVKCTVVIAGSGPEAEGLKKLTEEIGAMNVIFAGQVSDLEKISLIQGCTALILPSHLRSEAFGMVLVEASMFGRPIISCEIGTGTSYVNLHGETGFVVMPQNPGALATAMHELLEDERLGDSMGAAARKRYELLFSSRALGLAYSNLYRKLLNVD